MYVMLNQTGEYIAYTQCEGDGQKFFGLLGSSSAFFFPRRLRTPNFHVAGTFLVAQQELMMCSKAGVRDRHFLKHMVSGQGGLGTRKI